MRRLIAGLALVIALAPAGCRMRKKAAQKSASEDDGQLASVVNVAEPRTAVQLTQGFYGVENNSWRWTMKNFSVALRPPRGSNQNGATLQLSFALPDAVFNKVGAVTLSARVNGADVGAQTFTQPGESVYRRDVPAAALANEVVVVDFSVDKTLPPTAQDARELGIVVSTIGLVSK